MAATSSVISSSRSSCWDIGEPSSWRAASSMASMSSRSSSAPSRRRSPIRSKSSESTSSRCRTNSCQRRPRWRAGIIDDGLAPTSSAFEQHAQALEATARIDPEHGPKDDVEGERLGLRCRAIGSPRGQLATSRSASSATSPERRSIFSRGTPAASACAGSGGPRRAGSPSACQPPARGSGRPRPDAAPPGAP